MKVEAKGLYVPEIKNKTSLSAVSLNKFGVANIITVISFLGSIAKVFMQKGVSWVGKIMALFPLGWKAFGFAEALKHVPEEAQDVITQAEVAEIAQSFDELDIVVGDTESAVKELLPILTALKNWIYKYILKK